MLKDPEFRYAMVKFFGSADMARMILSQDYKVVPGKQKLEKVQISQE